MRKKLLALACNYAFIVLLFFILNEGLGLTKWINAIFYITILNMILFLYLFIAKGKFFDGIMYSFQRLFIKSSSSEEKLPSETVNTPAYELFKFNFITLASVLIVMQAVYFVIV